MGGNGTVSTSSTMAFGLKDTRFTPWTPETYPGIWLPYQEWNSVRVAINKEYGDDIEIIDYSSIVVGKYRYHFYVLEQDDYVITDKELIHGRRRTRR